mgnify:CR=1 FL=1
MKKIFFLVMTLMFMITLSGCGTSKEDDVVKSLTKKISSAESYSITGTFELINNEENYTYDINVNYKSAEKFKVSLVNKVNNHEQIILRNESGVYVLTPSLNKSFKFQSDWPYNNSQTYILQTLVKDIENDSEKDVKKLDDGYVITTSVNYSNKQDLVKQNIFLDKDINITKIEVLNSENQAKIVMNFNKIEFNSTINDDIFNIDNNVFSSEDNEKTVNTIDGIVFPMYVPTDTYLTSQDVISVDGGERAILTFSGEKPFTIIQETISNTDILNMNVDGEPQMIMDTIGVLSDSYVSWISGGMEYYVISEDLTQDELLTVANSISVMPVSK